MLIKIAIPIEISCVPLLPEIVDSYLLITLSEPLYTRPESSVMIAAHPVRLYRQSSTRLPILLLLAYQLSR